MEAEITAKISRLLVEKYQVPEDEVRPEATYSGMDVDSLTLVEIVISIEAMFGLTIPEGVVHYEQSIQDSARAMIVVSAA